ncbi:hypothetical protein AGDE_13044 [Angomonas deanei]|uniref:Uncharacterized protein n=1 Tax=Angomonas deanei TaxID=59799 RepID=A0A7G2C830_9TRYP|nr:hypothetical protein AGDE_13044 [Angomonas deanei]CAD2215739.1 hypothetical protein, conserved [Angomonas deanei]|eukprot:EPY23104.1 hypothetical protein AGDE_13044 [Angomonas deanei]
MGRGGSRVDTSPQRVNLALLLLPGVGLEADHLTIDKHVRAIPTEEVVGHGAVGRGVHDRPSLGDQHADRTRVPVQEPTATEEVVHQGGDHPQYECPTDTQDDNQPHRAAGAGPDVLPPLRLHALAGGEDTTLTLQVVRGGGVAEVVSLIVEVVIEGVNVDHILQLGQLDAIGFFFIGPLHKEKEHRQQYRIPEHVLVLFWVGNK